jgi:ABC-type nitrate/sulfonate/bicarbonate transport system substrate-binding protein
LTLPLVRYHDSSLPLRTRDQRRRSFNSVHLLKFVGKNTLRKPLAKITLNVFPGGFNWPSFVAQANGFFAANGLEVVLQPTPNSVAQMTGLSRDEFQIAITAIDNIVAYVEGQGEPPMGAQPEFVAFMGSDSGFLSLMAQREVKDWGDLQGKTLSVDARTTGYAFVLFEMLRRNGLADDDYKIVRAGGMTQRWEALRAQKQDATLLSTPFDLLAEAHGLHRLARATDVIGPYQGNVAAAKRSWVAAHADEVIGFIRAYAAAIEWLYDPSNRDEAVPILMAALPQMTAELAQRSYEQLLNPARGFFRQAKIDANGLKTVLELRSRYGEPNRLLTEPAKYYDATYYETALGN